MPPAGQGSCAAERSMLDATIGAIRNLLEAFFFGAGGAD
jgi:hypothetical protein